MLRVKKLQPQVFVVLIELVRDVLVFAAAFLEQLKRATRQQVFR